MELEALWFLDCSKSGFLPSQLWLAGLFQVELPQTCRERKNKDRGDDVSTSVNISDNKTCLKGVRDWGGKR